MNAGDEILVIAGEEGTPFADSYFNLGGGAPTSFAYGDNQYAGGGGGASGIWYLTGTSQRRDPIAESGTDSQTVYANQFVESATVMMAGGGGGGGSSRAGRGNAGGAGGGANGQDGKSPYDGKADMRGRGGSQSAGGSGGPGGDGVQFAGGSPSGNAYGGGGGGGWFGGEGGSYSEENTMSGGGGGSGYFNPEYVTGAKLLRGVDRTPANTYFGTAGLGGEDNGQPGQDGFVRLTVDGTDYNFEKGSHVFVCNPLVDVGQQLGSLDDVGGTGFATSGIDVAALNDGWHHLTVVATGNGAKFWLDDQLAKEHQTNSATNIFQIGNYGSDQPWGYLSRFRLWGSAFNTEQVLGLRHSPPRPILCVDATDTGIAVDGIGAHIIGSPSSVTGPAGGSGLHFGDQDLVILSPPIDLSGPEWTLDLWVKLPLLPGGEHIVAAGRRDQHLKFSADRQHFGTWSNDVFADLDSEPTSRDLEDTCY